MKVSKLQMKRRKNISLDEHGSIAPNPTKRCGTLWEQQKIHAHKHL
jgi:hypothetical protein